MRNHYVPIHYLRAFSVPSSRDFIYQHDLYRSTSERLNLKNVAVVCDLYPEELEWHITREIENPALALLEKIRNNECLGDSEKPIMSRYLLTLLRRGPRGKESTLQGARELLPEQIQMILDQVADLLMAGKISQERHDVVVSEVNDIERRYMANMPEYFWYENVDSATLLRTHKALSSMAWTYITTETTDGFVTADIPLWFPTGSGLRHPQAEVVFPISPRCCIVLTWYDNYRDKFRNVDFSIVREVNRRLILGADRFVFTYTEKPWIFTLHKNQPSIRVFTPFK